MTRPMTAFLATTALACGLLAALPRDAAAQSMSAEEILKRIQLQREAKAAAAEEERTRALKFAGTSQRANPASEPTAVVSTTPGETPVAAADAPPTLPGTSPTLTAPATDTSPATPATLAATTGTAVSPALVEAAVTEAVPVYAPEVSIDLVVYFEFDSAILKPEAKDQLGQLCEAFRADTGTYTIIGHTDAAGSDEYNLRLSRLRAEEVVRYVTTTCGIAGDRMRAIGLGEARLKDPSDPRSGVNRRVEIQVDS